MQGMPTRRLSRRAARTAAEGAFAAWLKMMATATVLDRTVQTAAAFAHLTPSMSSGPEPTATGYPISLTGVSETGRQLREERSPVYDEAELVVGVSGGVCRYLARKSQVRENAAIFCKRH